MLVQTLIQLRLRLTRDLVCELARAGISVLENLNLSAIRDGDYDLCAFPIKLGGLEAAPCRAIILEQERGLN